MKKIVVLMLLTASMSALGQDKNVLYEMVELDRGVNSRFHDAAPIVSPDGNTLYFFVANHPQNRYGINNTQDIWYSEKDEYGRWKDAVHLDPPLNMHRFNQVLSVLEDGNLLFIRGGKGNSDEGFSYTRRLNGKWSEPEPVEVKGYEKMKKGMFSGGYLSSDGKILLLYFSETEKSKHSDIYVSFQEGKNQFSRPVKIEAPISTRRDEFGPYLTSDMKTMYFASNRWGGLGASDIYRTERLDETWLKWSEPVNIGEPINTAGFDAYFSIDADERTAFTTRAFMSADGGHLNIIGLMPRPEIYLTGTVYNRETNETIEAGVEYIAYKKDTGFLMTNKKGIFETTLTYRAMYYFIVDKEGFEILWDSLDLRNAEDFMKVQKDLYLIPQTANIVLSGAVMEEGTGYPLESEISISCGNQIILTTRSEPIQGTYRIQLPGNGSYFFNIDQRDYFPLKDSIKIHTDLTHDEFEKDLYLKPMIRLSGFVMNQKDDELMSVTVEYEDEHSNRNSFTSDNNGYYHILLPDEGKYWFHATKEGFLNLNDSLSIAGYNPREGLMKNLYMRPIEVGVTVRLNRIFFDFDKTNLRPESFPSLDKVVAFMNENPSISIEIGGHTDSMGTDEYNINLSQGRANAVREYLVHEGIQKSRVVSVGYGENKPEASNETDEGRQTNRRVEFKVLGNSSKP
jgi:outer membrane protein OmpA-like peptidoglycan-associated protein